ncbi:MAG TPA: inositol-3-phosphate synthase [Thermodesulfobium narugense]|uniref:L-myo-inositol-1-phosphate synthase n=1 Tax=Thermodesulfobium acidiphilum TaxID=1794699 RepID=A0A2R4VZE2_THEAF|nr:inositol-3-phosphate synthase [Thermodesulfobium acidiphilum]AWB09923.1 L-myo-inositol-1-phosphate synthase [Thermodesulfobium acidiphilum]PMP86650.1 MAG: inositol-3-phosphate synthase [Thermodesulfobium narugense]HEM55576.1 inositol-3-phosphate synthase [Thermodesulfobium narugense]
MQEIRVAIVGVGNCASSLVQGVEFYKNSHKKPIGLIHEKIGPYKLENIRFVAAFDIDERKVDKDLSEAIFTAPNNTIKLHDVPNLGVTVMRGHTNDGIGKYAAKAIIESKKEPVDVVKVLKESKADVLINYLPVGSQKATEFYMNCALEANLGVINAIPVFIASNSDWAKKFEDKNLPIIGDDIKSQLGATILHRALTQICLDRGLEIERTFQLNVGGNLDFLNMLERERLESKKISKTNAVNSLMPEPMSEENIHIGPSDYIPWLHDRKWAYIRIESKAFGEVPLNIECKLEVWDSPNSAGIIVDALRLVKLAKDRKLGGPIISACAYLMKSPPVQYPDTQARAMLESFIKGE